MKRSLNQMMEQAVARAKRMRNRRRVLALLSAVVMLFTMNRTMFRADALEGVPVSDTDDQFEAVILYGDEPEPQPDDETAWDDALTLEAEAVEPAMAEQEYALSTDEDGEALPCAAEDDAESDATPPAETPEDVPCIEEIEEIEEGDEPDNGLTLEGVDEAPAEAEETQEPIEVPEIIEPDETPQDEQETLGEEATEVGEVDAEQDEEEEVIEEARTEEQEEETIEESEPEEQREEEVIEEAEIEEQEKEVIEESESGEQNEEEVIEEAEPEEQEEEVIEAVEPEEQGEEEVAEAVVTGEQGEEEEVIEETETEEQGEEEAVIEDAEARATKPMLDLGLAVVTPADEGLAFDEDATGSAGLLTGAEAAEALAAVACAEAEVVEEAAVPEAPAAELTAPEAVEPAGVIQTTATRTAYQAFSISLENVDEAEYADGFNVTVTLPEALDADNPQLYHILEGDQVEAIPLEDVTDDGFSFTADRLDTFVLSYTVDFEYAEYPFSIPGGASIALSELFAALRIERSAADAVGVAFSDPELVSVARMEGDWLLTSLQPFLSEETLTIAFDNGDVIVIRVTDAQYELDDGESTGGWTKNIELKLENENGEMVTVADNTPAAIPEFARFELDFAYEMPAGSEGGFPGIASDDTVTFPVPWIWNVGTDSMDADHPNALEDSSGAVMARWWIADGQIVVQYDSAWLAAHPNFGISTQLHLSGRVDTTNTEYEHALPIAIDQTVICQPVVKKRLNGGVCNVGFDKTMTAIDETQDHRKNGATYQLVVEAKPDNNMDLFNPAIEDQFHIGERFLYLANAPAVPVDYYNHCIQYLQDEGHLRYRIIGPDNTERMPGPDEGLVLVPDTDAASARFVFTGRLHPGEKLVIDYDVAFDENIYKDNPRAENIPTNESDTRYFSDGHEGDYTNSHIDGMERSWMHREVSNQATLQCNDLSNPTDEGRPGEFGPVQGKDGREGHTGDATLNFNKTWLWKKGDYNKDRQENRAVYRLVVNEGQMSDIGGWVLEDDIAQYHQCIISGIIVQRGDFNDQAVVDVNDLNRTGYAGAGAYDFISLADLQNGNTAGTRFEGSTPTHIRYTFENGEAQYRFVYMTKYDEGHHKAGFHCENGAVLTEPAANGGHTYGVYESHENPANTVVKNFISKNIEDGTLNWETTITDYVGTLEGSVYYDFVGFKCWPDGEGSADYTGHFAQTDSRFMNNHTIGTLNGDPTTIDPNKLNLVVKRFPDRNDDTHFEVLQEGVDYRLERALLTDASELKNYEGNPVNVSEVVYGFKVTFLKPFNDDIKLCYQTLGQFDMKQWYINKCYYYKDGVGPGKNYIFDSKWPEYNPVSSINKSASFVTCDADGHYAETKQLAQDGDGSSIIKWHLTVNGDCYDVADLVVLDTIPEGLDFVLERDLQLRWVDYNAERQGERVWRTDYNREFCGNENAPYDTYPPAPVVNLDNRYFSAAYDAQTRQLRLVLRDMTHKKVEFNVYTHLNPEKLASALTYADRASFMNTASVCLYQESAQDGIGPGLGSWSASAELWYSLIDKTCGYHGGPNANYTVTLNPAGGWIGSEDWITISDVPAKQADITLDLNSLRVKSGGRALTIVQGREPVMGRDEVGLTVTHENPSAGSFRLKVPNGMPITLEYSAQVEGFDGAVPDLDNAVTLTIDGSDVQKVNEPNTVAFTAASGSGSGMNYITLRKVNARNRDIALPGAVFAVERQDGESWVPADASHPTITTGQDGVASTYHSDGVGNIRLETGVIYRLREQEAPEGYVNSGYEKAFVFVTGAEGRDAIAAYRAQGIQVIYVGNDRFTFVVENEPDIRVDIGMLKIDENTREAATPTTLGGAEFTLYRWAEADGTDAAGYRACGAQSTGDDGRLSFANLVAGRYRIDETRLPDGYVFYGAPTQLYFTISDDLGEVTWRDGDGNPLSGKVNMVTFDDNTFTVGNMPGVKLPSTGGMGTLPFTVGGLLLMLSAAVLLLGRRGR